MIPTFPGVSRKENLPDALGISSSEYNGIDLSIKDSKRFAKTNGWGFFTFGHHPLPYDKVAAEKPVTQMCPDCTSPNVAATDMTWIQFCPLLRDKKGY